MTQKRWSRDANELAEQFVGEATGRAPAEPAEDQPRVHRALRESSTCIGLTRPVQSDSPVGRRRWSESSQAAYSDASSALTRSRNSAWNASSV